MSTFKKRLRFGITSVVALFAVALLVIGLHVFSAADNEASATNVEHYGPAFPDAEVVHVVAENNTGEVVETWIDQLSGDVLKKTSDKDGIIREVITRHDTTMSTFVVTDQSTGFYVRTVLSTSDPYLDEATDDLDGARLSLEQGKLANLGEEEFQGQHALKAQIPDGEFAGTIFYLDPTTLYPLGHVFPGAGASITTYKTIETLQRVDVPDSVFQFDPPATDYRETYHQLTSEDIERFSAYPLVNLGTTFGDYQLFRIERYQSQNKGNDSEDKTYSIYRQFDSSTKTMVEVQVTSRPPLSEKERAGVERAVQDGVLESAEPVMVGGTAAMLRPAEGAGVSLEIERPDAFISIIAPDRDTALAAGAALQPAVAAPLER